jgi:hypothetical protein
MDDERKIPSHLKMLRREKTSFWRGGQTRPQVERRSGEENS